MSPRPWPPRHRLGGVSPAPGARATPCRCCLPETVCGQRDPVQSPPSPPRDHRRTGLLDSLDGWARRWVRTVAEGGHDYPAHWEADIVLRDGGTAHLRPIRPDDADRLRRFQSRLSDETIYFRFFSLYRDLSPKDVERFTVVDYHDRVALIATIGDEMIGVVRYERIDKSSAEAAFNIEDAHQRRGLGSLSLEHIAAAARERGNPR